jgi:N-acetylglucosaminyldiphosphoundecaprenol N-acetyl-beta-D-mannosaminyltransferase
VSLTEAAYGSLPVSTRPALQALRRRPVAAPSRPDHPVFACNGVRIDACTLDVAVDRILDLSLADRGADVHLCNAYTVALAQRDPSYRELLNSSTLNLPDGTPITWVGRAMGHRLPGPTRGHDVLMATLRAGVPFGIKHYFYGATQQTVDAMVRELRLEVPDAMIVGAEAPPFRDLTAAEERATKSRLRSSGAHVVWVGLGTPKQDVFASSFAADVEAVFVPIGAAFDFVAKSKRHAPEWMQGSGLEWTFRLATEPRRLAGRYFWGNATFLATVGRSRREAPAAVLTA